MRTPGGHRRFLRDAIEAFVGSDGAATGPESLDRVGRWLHVLQAPAGEYSVVELLLSDMRRFGSWWRTADAMTPVIDELRRRHREGEISLIQVRDASDKLRRALARCADMLKSASDAPTALLMAAAGDHDTSGLRLFEVCLRAAGWSVVWAGRDISASAVASYLASHGVRLVLATAASGAVAADALADQATALGTACATRRVQLALAGDAWPAQLAHGNRVESYAELESLLKREPERDVTPESYS